jgi:ubiquinone/menaquinone biosynthesis C-methylase UbiE
MDPKLQRRVQRYGWDRASAYYEAFWQKQLKPAQDLLLQLAAIQPEDRVLDIASGTGLVSFGALEKLGPNGFLLGTDISEKMVQLAASLAAQRKEDRAQFRWMDAEDLQLESLSFDVALCALGLMYFPDPQKALKEMRRVLKPGGHALAAVWGQREHCGWSEIFEIVDRHVASEVCPMFFNLGNPKMLELSFMSAGFTEIQVTRISSILSYRNDQEALGAAFDGGPVALAYHKFSLPVRDQVHEAYLDSLAPFKQGAGYEVPGEFVLAKGTA